jgi:antitoxin (DNA-binding transcriptional repressor) of toxin-antitoxin stability system
LALVSRLMKQIDLDDLPPRVSQILGRLEAGEVLVLVQGGGLVARLTVDTPAPPAAESLADLPPEEAMVEVMEHFKSMVDDAF